MQQERTKSAGERVTVIHRWKDGESQFVVLYDKPHSRKLREIGTFAAGLDPDAPESSDAHLAAHYFRQGYAQALADAAQQES